MQLYKTQLFLISLSITDREAFKKAIKSFLLLLLLLNSAMKTKIMLSVLLVFFLIFTNIVLMDEIHEAVKDGNFENVKSLVDYNPTTVNAKDDRSCTSLHFAAETGHKEIAEFLLANGAVIDVSEINSNTPLHYASMNGKAELAELLLTNGADINAQNKDQFASLHLAACNKNKSFIKLFVETVNWNIMETL
jgi:ankyrin repeat protein